MAPTYLRGGVPVRPRRSRVSVSSVVTLSAPGMPMPPCESMAIASFMHMRLPSTQRFTMASNRPGAKVA
ncbi:hypothetical protein D3C71_1909310 [compost metagenome]